MGQNVIHFIIIFSIIFSSLLHMYRRLPSEIFRADKDI